MNRESERHYVSRHEHTDDLGRWEDEAGYFRGLGDDGMFTTDATLTPSGDATRQTSSGSSWVDAFKAALPAVAGVVQQREFNKMNLALINTGKPPMSAQQYTNVYQPAAARVVVGPTDDAKKWMTYAAVALAAYLGLRAAKVI